MIVKSFVTQLAVQIPHPLCNYHIINNNKKGSKWSVYWVNKPFIQLFYWISFYFFHFFLPYHKAILQEGKREMGKDTHSRHIYVVIYMIKCKWQGLEWQNHSSSSRCILCTTTNWVVWSVLHCHINTCNHSHVTIINSRNHLFSLKQLCRWSLKEIELQVMEPWNDGAVEDVLISMPLIWSCPLEDCFPLFLLSSSSTITDLESPKAALDFQSNVSSKILLQ